MADVAFSIPNSRSLLLDGDLDYLFTSPIPFTYRSTFTIECWFKTNSIGTQRGIFFSGDIALNDRRVQLEITAEARLYFYIQETTVNQSWFSEPGVISPNTWYHVAVVASYQGPTTMYLNGIPVATANMTVPLSDTFANNLRIGVARSGSISRYFDGYISNFRVVNGSAVYTSTFTPPTQPLYPIQNTTFLTCQSPIIIDKSYNPLPITVVGNARVDDENPFGFSTSTSVSADLFDDISTTDSVINLKILAAKSVFDIIDIQSSIDSPVNAVGTDSIINLQIPTAKSVFDIIDIQSSIDSPVSAVGTDALIFRQSSAKLEFNIIDIQSSIDSPVSAVGTDALIIPTILPSQSVLQYNVNSRNNFSNDELVVSFDDAVNISQFLKTQIAERTSPQKINSLRILVENTQTVVNYSYWI